MIDATAHAQIVGAIFYHIRAVTEDGKPAGEVGEACNILKKLDRERMGEMEAKR